jgi:hypothetical protein
MNDNVINRIEYMNKSYSISDAEEMLKLDNISYTKKEDLNLIISDFIDSEGSPMFTRVAMLIGPSYITLKSSINAKLSNENKNESLFLVNQKNIQIPFGSFEVSLEDIVFFKTAIITPPTPQKEFVKNTFYLTMAYASKIKEFFHAGEITSFIEL